MSDFLEIKNFNIKQLDEDGKAVLDEFEQRFIELRKKRANLPPEFYEMATDFHTASCRAQTEVQKITMQHFAAELKKDQKFGCEFDAIRNWQKRKAVKEAFIQGQHRLRRPLPWRYDFWGNLLQLIKGALGISILQAILQFFTRKHPKIDAVASVRATTTPPEPAPKQLPPDTKNPTTGARKPASADIDPVGNVPTDKSKQPPAPASLPAAVAVSRHSLIKEQGK